MAPTLGGPTTAVVVPRPVTGTRIAVVSPADQSMITTPRRFRSGLSWLRSQGFRPEVMPAAAVSDRRPGPAERAADLMAAIEDPDIPLALATMGGNAAVSLLPHLDARSLADRPTVLQGGSDITTLLWWAHHATEVPMYYGPMLCMGLAEEPMPFAEARDGLLAAWSGSPLHCAPASRWTEELLPIDAPWDSPAQDQHRPSTGPVRWRTLRPGIARGTLLAGCLEVLVWYVRSLPAWSLLHRGDVVLALDIALPGARWSESQLGGPAGVDTLLHAFGQSGGWDRVTGLLVGRPRGYLAHERAELYRVLLTHVPPGVPVIADADLGHTEPTLTLPLGARAELDTSVPHLEIRP
ncbi:LD-carboxypeptidase [Streptomyces sp. TG1A-8]|uniref:S66 peptidase family protein n=1 Tax=Streptomyces sp. TG1A-8 TaxID=3051385 RepID=UPI00265C78CE|nr:LD-carboxypeptidase [Streptomyces sp. TG1A-8]MDO0925014.1 LD-carboxypeptidase [Streptomyces sp. TG1A-8]